MTTDAPGASAATPTATTPRRPTRWGRCTLGALLVVAAWGAGAGALGGAVALWSALAGGALVVLVLAATPLILGPLVRAMPGLAMVVALMFFMVKATLLAALLVAISSDTVRDATDSGAFAWGAVVGAATWIALATVAVMWPRHVAAADRETSTSSPTTDDEQRLVASRAVESERGRG